MHEYELEAEFLRVTLGGGLRHTGYPSIVAAGRNAATLHYDRNNAPVGKDELVLVDAGAEFRYCLLGRAGHNYWAQMVATKHAIVLNDEMQSQRLVPDGFLDNHGHLGLTPCVARVNTLNPCHAGGMQLQQRSEHTAGNIFAVLRICF